MHIFTKFGGRGQRISTCWWAGYTSLRGHLWQIERRRQFACCFLQHTVRHEAQSIQQTVLWKDIYEPGLEGGLLGIPKKVGEASDDHTAGW
jgi:hypothetical protein